MKTTPKKCREKEVGESTRTAEERKERNNEGSGQNCKQGQLEQTQQSTN